VEGRGTNLYLDGVGKNNAKKIEKAIAAQAPGFH